MHLLSVVSLNAQELLQFAAFKRHTYGHKYGIKKTKLDRIGDVTCHIDFCSYKCEDIQGLVSHLKSHITEGKTVTCPFKHCDKKITEKSTFTSHMSRKHNDYAKESLVDSISNSISTSDCNDEGDMQLDNASQTSYEEMEVYPENADEGQFLRKFALFYLKLQAKLLLSSSTI